MPQSRPLFVAATWSPVRRGGAREARPLLSAEGGGQNQGPEAEGRAGSRGPTGWVQGILSGLDPETREPEVVVRSRDTCPKGGTVYRRSRRQKWSQMQGRRDPRPPGQGWVQGSGGPRFQGPKISDSTMVHATKTWSTCTQSDHKNTDLWIFPSGIRTHYGLICPIHSSLSILTTRSKADHDD